MAEVKFDHVACGVESLAAVAGFLEGVLGAAPHAGGPGHGFRGFQWRFANDALLEVIEPQGEPGGFLHRFIAGGGSRIHHVTFKVPELGAAAARARELGYQVVGFRDDNPGWKEAFLHPKQALGIVVQIAESHPELDDNPWLPLPDDSAAAASRPQPLAMLGLSMSVGDIGAAYRQWAELLGADAVEDRSEGERTVTFSWPESPMSIRVCERPGVEQGPVGIRVAGRPLELPRTPQPALGTTFLYSQG